MRQVRMTNHWLVQPPLELLSPYIITDRTVDNLTVLGLELHDTSDGAKYLLSDDLHVGPALRENCWLNVVSLFANPVAT